MTVFSMDQWHRNDPKCNAVLHLSHACTCKPLAKLFSTPRIYEFSSVLACHLGVVLQWKHFTKITKGKVEKFSTLIQ
ncbi:hypothetical protein EBB79_10040 [Parasedimentitalea marina]|uniref:Uncharacterized protein n=1 Tax=Parasedimentitalea marina TaxID=2483033 RepID=A0A3T0N2H2_9RHOB|nr:hypothetical protein EBB79_10040 [Parasedimentitalea marina]